MRLARFVQLHPEAIDSSLQRLNAASQGITELDVHPTILSLLTTDAPAELRRAVSSFPLCTSPPSADGSEASLSDLLEPGVAGMNTALALSLHTVILSRNRLTSALGVVQFKHVVRLSLLGNRIQRVEDCAALALLPALRYLSLEFNPVATLAHYRAHMLRLCAWPERLEPRHCRLRKLDARAVTPAEVTRASECLQRETATLPELTQRMRLLTFLEEAERRVHLHHEMRRRGLLVRDTHATLSAEAVVTRCSAQLLTRVDGAHAAHLARRLMSGRCRMCAVDLNENGSANVSATPGESLSSTVISETRVGLRNVMESAHKAFCKDWSRDVFRRAMATLDHGICAALLAIAHALDEELTVMDMDRLNKLWFGQVAKVDKWCMQEQSHVMRERPPQTYNQTVRRQGSERVVKMNSHNRTPTMRAVDERTTHSFKKIMIPVSVLEEKRGGTSTVTSKRTTTTDHDHEVKEVEVSLSLRSISPIASRAGRTSSTCDESAEFPAEAPTPFPAPLQEVMRTSERERTLQVGRPVRPTQAKAEMKHNKNQEEKDATKEEEEVTRTQSLSGVRSHTTIPVEGTETGNRVDEGKEKSLARQWALRRVFTRWANQAQRERLASAFAERRMNALLSLAFPSPEALALLPRAERKRLLLHHWREMARRSYAPRTFQLARLLARWRWRAYESYVVATIEAGRRSAALEDTWEQWRWALDVRRRRLAAEVQRAAVESNTHNDKRGSEEVTACSDTNGCSDANGCSEVHGCSGKEDRSIEEALVTDKGYADFTDSGVNRTTEGTNNRAFSESVVVRALSETQLGNCVSVNDVRNDKNAVVACDEHKDYHRSDALSNVNSGIIAQHSKHSLLMSNSCIKEHKEARTPMSSIGDSIIIDYAGLAVHGNNFSGVLPLQELPPPPLFSHPISLASEGKRVDDGIEILGINDSETLRNDHGEETEAINTERVIRARSDGVVNSSRDTIGPSKVVRVPVVSCGTQVSMDDVCHAANREALTEAQETVSLLCADRQRLVDRIIALEQQASQESIRAMRSEEEIKELREQLRAMELREECIKATSNDYKQEIEHLRAVVLALRKERRENLALSMY